MTAIITRTAACLRPEAMESSLIFPATIPMMKLWNMTEVMNMVCISVFGSGGGMPGAVMPVVRPIIITVVATSRIDAK